MFCVGGFILQYNENQNSHPGLWNDDEHLKSAVASCVTRVFAWMFAALCVTAIAALAVVRFESLQAFVFSSDVVFFGLIIAQLALVMGVSAGIGRLSSSTAIALFFFYAALNGLTLSSIFMVYEIGTIYNAFAVCALTFAVMAIYGATTRKDLSSIGSLCIMALFGLIAASVLNIFLRSDALDFIVSYAGILIFVGLTAYDTQRTKRMLSEAVAANCEEAVRKVSVLGALSLYLNFINLFLRILRVMGRRR